MTVIDVTGWGDAVEAMIMPLLRFYDFRGRSTRTEFWMYWMMMFTVLVVLAVLHLVSIGPEGPRAGAAGALYTAMTVISVVTFIPSVAVTVRRFHDQGRSGWVILTAFIPFVGSLVLLAFMMVPGTEGENRWGYDPR